MFGIGRKLVAFCLVAGAFGGWARLAHGPETRPVAQTRYVVRSGDTLWEIARRLAPTRDPRAVIQKLIEANDLGSPALRPGQTLVVPRL